MFFILFFAVAERSVADIKYEYIGNDFNEFQNFTNPPYDRISGFFTLAEALPDYGEIPIVSPVYFKFTDGERIFESTNPGVTINEFRIVTSQGEIVNWRIQLTFPYVSGDPTSYHDTIITLNYNNESPREDDIGDGTYHNYYNPLGGGTSPCRGREKSNFRLCVYL